MDKDEFILNIEKDINNPSIIQGIFNWCDRWCERCYYTVNCTLFRNSTPVMNNKPEDFFKEISIIFDTTINLLKKYAYINGIDLDATVETDDRYEENRDIALNDNKLLLVKQYGKQVDTWLKLLQEREEYGLKIRLKDEILADCLEIITWYQYLLEVKIMRALMSQKEEEQNNEQPYDSLGIAKLLLISIDRNIGAWGYIYKKFEEDEDLILEILVCLQQLSKQIESTFPNAREFIRPGLDE